MSRAAIPALFLLLASAPAFAGPICEASWIDASRDNRAIPVRIRMPDGAGKAPVVLFSHGLGGSLDSGTRWAEAWSRAGIAVINIQHPGSDRSIIGSGGFLAAMSPAQLAARVGDVHFVIDQLSRRKREGACDLTRFDLTRIGMSGHSFGAHTTLAIAGQRYAGDFGKGFADPRVKAAIAFSPAPPMRGSDGDAFGAIAIPVMSVTGTADTTPVLPQISAADRQRPFRAMPAGGKYLLVLSGATHMDYNGQDNVRWRAARSDPRIAELTIAATTDFWRWTLLGDAGARRDLDSLKARLGPEDLFAAR